MGQYSVDSTAGRRRGFFRRFVVIEAVVVIVLAGLAAWKFWGTADADPLAATSSSGAPSPDDAAPSEPSPVASSVPTSPTPPPTTPPPPPTTPVETRPVAAVSRLLFAGTTFWGRYTEDHARQDALGEAFAFARLGELERQNYDAWIGQLECALVDEVDASSEEQNQTLELICPTEALTEAARWFTAFSLGTNHSLDRGEEGFERTEQRLESAGIQYFGHFDPARTDKTCGVVVVEVNIANQDGTNEPGHLPLAICAYNGVYSIPPAESIDLIATYSELLPVIAMPHMGAEYVAGPDEIKTTTYHAMIDRGADMVMGDHPHWIQPAEVYDGKLIVYSMGNFMFDQQRNEEVIRSAAIKVTATAEAADNPSLDGWLDLAESCRDGLDVCMALAAEQGLEPLKLTYDFGFVGTSDLGYQTYLASPPEQAAIEGRLGWDAAMAQLGQ